MACGLELWVQRIYELRQDAAMESDVQDRFISSLRKTFFGSKPKFEDEAGNFFLDEGNRGRSANCPAHDQATQAREEKPEEHSRSGPVRLCVLVALPSSPLTVF